ncbi:MAG: hypothetical protein GWN53_17260 [Gammaproteobacteria bacterium]|uniref:Major capsid protein n=1 Tax=Candidatus Kutchimonas denitrificans TaxID=3056748 RepID=A0AAE4ZAT4_9BACT|nr:hypothetical protein [Candidatus Kutchimonas denitrificans]NIV53591.1 hypothetical protein [Gammaproteobacteria bacterium]
MALVSGLSYDAFKPELWSAELNFSLKNALVADSLVNRNWQGDIQQFGDTVHIQEPGSVTSRAYTAYSDITWEQPSPTDRTLVIDNADYTAVDVDDIDEAQARVDLMQSHMQEAAFSLADTEDAFIFEMYTDANSGVSSDHANSLALTAGNVYQRFVEAAFVLDTQDVPKTGRWAAITPEETSLIRQAGQFVPVDDSSNNRAGGGTSDSARIVRTGEVGQIAGFTVFESNNMTTVSGVKKLLFGTRRATTFANQITEMEAIRRESRFADGVKSLNVYGKSTQRAEALALLHVTA